MAPRYGLPFEITAPAISRETVEWEYGHAYPLIRVDVTALSQVATGPASRGNVVGVRPRPVVVTDMHEPLIVVHRRMMRQRLVLMVIWIAGWVVAGVLYRHGYLATAILLVSGPGVWLVHYAWRWWHAPGHREPVTRRASENRALEGPASAGTR